MGGFLRSWLNGENYEICSTYANACGALVVSRHSCAPAIPTREELDYYLTNAHKIHLPDQDVLLNHLHKATTRKPATDYWQNLNILAFDHQIQFEELAKECNIPSEERHLKIKELKKLIAKAVSKVEKKIRDDNSLPKKQIGILLDGQYGQDILNDITGTGLWIARPVEKPKSHPIRFEPLPDIGSEIIS